MERLILEFSGEQLEFAEATNFVSRGENPPEKRPVYYLNSSGEYMGLEFTLFWRYGVGFEVTALNKQTNNCDSLGQYYLAPTDEANHFISIETDANGKAWFTHEALTIQETTEYLKRILEGQETQTAVTKVKEPTGKNFCEHCGAKIQKNASFCTECGNKLR